jgi:hypothetical protein
LTASTAINSLALDQVGEEGPEGGAQVFAVDGQFHGGPQVVELVAHVEAALLEHEAVHGLLLDEQGDGVGELDLLVGARLHPLEAVEDLGGEDVPAHHGQVGRRLLGSRLLDDAEDPHQRLVERLGEGAPVGADLAAGKLLEGHDRPAVALVDGHHVGEDGGVGRHDVVAQHDHEGLVAHVLAGHRHGVAEAAGLALADVVDVGHLGDGLHLLQHVELAGLPEVVLELEGAVEVVLDGPLAPAGDDQDVAQADPDGLLHHVLDGRLVDEGQHLLGLGLGGREEPGAQPGGGDDRLADPLQSAPRSGRLGRMSPATACSTRLRPPALARYMAASAAATRSLPEEPCSG